MRFHVLGIPHTISTPEFVTCAFTAKVVKFCEMMTARGHEIIHYGHEDSNVACAEHVTVLPNKIWKKCYGDHDWKTHFFKFDTNDLAHTTFNENTIKEIGKRKQPNDFILAFWGGPMKPIYDAHPDLICVEPGIGYAYGHFAPYKVFESYAAHSAYYGLASLSHCNEKWYDVVIPNYFNTNDFQYKSEKQDYFLYIGRVYDGKGVNIAIQATEKIGAKLILAGQGSLKEMGYDEVPSHVTEFGFANAIDRQRLMADAKAVFAPSLYNEPFCGTHVEAMMSGTPVITTDWGAFTEYNIHGVTGYRCRTFEHFVWAAKNIDKIDTWKCNVWARKNFGYDKVGHMYEEYFQSLLNIHGKDGWYEPNDSRTELDWLKKEYPGLPEKIDYPATAAEEQPFADRIAVWIDEYMRPNKVFDIGCGPGMYVYALDKKGVNVEGLDIDPRVDGKNLITQADMLELDGTKQADLVIMFEVAEHIDPQYNDGIVNGVFNSIEDGGMLIFTAAQPGQGGVGHINNRPRQYWLDKFVAKGLINEMRTEEDLVQYCRAGYHMGWFVNNVICLRKPK